MSKTYPWDDLITDLDRVLYANYARPLPVLKKPALLLIDYYNCVFGDKPQALPQALKRFPRSCGLGAWQALPSARRVLETARRQKIPVFYTKDQFPPKKGVWPTKRNLKKLPTKWDCEIVTQLSPIDGEVVISKDRASGFFGTPLLRKLRALDIDGLIVAGETTSGCVRATVIDAYSFGFPILVVEEATFDRFALSHKTSLFDIHCKYAWVVKEKFALGIMKNAKTTP